MLHPSYTDLMKVVNAEVEPGEEPVVSSRYSIVMATSKRAAGGESCFAGFSFYDKNILKDFYYENHVCLSRLRQESGGYGDDAGAALRERV